MSAGIPPAGATPSGPRGKIKPSVCFAGLTAALAGLRYGSLNADFMLFFVLCVFCVPETKGVSLESIEKRLPGGTPLRGIGK